MTVTINLGDQAKDAVTGFEGICIARTLWLNGCVRVSLQSMKLDKDGKPQDGQTFDEPQLILVKARKVNVGQDVPQQPLPSTTPPLLGRRTGGPIPRVVRVSVSGEEAVMRRSTMPKRG